MQVRLQRSERLHRFIVNNSPDIIFMLDEDGVFSFVNSKVEKLLHYSGDELLGKHITYIVEDEDIEHARFFFRHIDLNSDLARTIELALKHRDNQKSKHYFELCVWPINEKNSDQLTANRNNMRFYGTARDITERREAEAFINFQAYHDLLTKLPNRALFKDRLNMAVEQAKRNKTKLAIMFLDLDRFKIVNDSLGHTVGDRLLQAVSLRLTRCLRRGDTLSRFGGDEFTLLLPEVKDESGAEKIAQKITKAMKQPFRLGEHEIYVGASIGIVLYPGGGSDIESLIQNADIAMYQVKESSKEGYGFYHRAMNAATTNRLHFERDIRRALENDEFRVHYQPQIDSLTGRIIGVEALIRWQHPTRGFIMPGEFIPIAEESRLILEVDQWVLRQACREVKAWFDAGVPKMRLAVNFSPLLVEQSNFVEMLVRTLDDLEFPRDCFELEITENVILSDLDHIIEKLLRLNEEGVTIAIDDFGTGYSSLSYLQKFPIDTLKIDQSFVQNITEKDDEACIVNAIVAMAHGLKLNIVAEGVETECQRVYLRELGCQSMQGFLFGRAVCASELITSVNGNNIALMESLEMDIRP
jgi:diguanylate cyclase (GGDEF)-like protein/PAS domain S-box-containing protein